MVPALEGPSLPEHESTAMSTAALWIVSLVTALPVTPAPAIRNPAWLSSARHVETDRAKVSIWMDRQNPYHRGDDAQVFIKADQDAYVTVLRIDTDGRVRILFPIDPGDDNFARGGQAFEVLGRAHSGAFSVDDAPGQGYVFAISSTDPFTYDGYVTGDHWDYRTIADGRVREDPYVAVTDLAAQIAPEGSWDYDMVGYDVEQHYDYPRFVCYDCHAYTSYYSWNPYDHFCSQYRIVIYDDPFYYPYRYYGGGAVYVRPLRPGPRYVFKDYDGSSGYVSRLPYRPRTPDGRSLPDRGRTSADIGGRGTVAIPVSGGGRRVDPLAGGRGERPGERDGNGRTGGRFGTPETGRPAEPGRRGGSDQSGAEPGRTGTGSSSDEHRPIRRGDPQKPNQPEGQSERERRPAVEPRRPPERHDNPPPRNNDRPPPAVQPRTSPPPAAQPRSSPPPSKPTGAPELRRRKP